MADFARGHRLVELREARHLSQEDAAHEIGVSVKSLRAWEHGGKIRWPNAQAAGEFYGIDPERLVSRTEDGASSEAPDETPDLTGTFSGAMPDDLRAEVVELHRKLDDLLSKVELLASAVGALSAAAEERDREQPSKPAARPRRTRRRATG